MPFWNPTVTIATMVTHLSSTVSDSPNVAFYKAWSFIILTNIVHGFKVSIISFALLYGATLNIQCHLTGSRSSSRSNYNISMFIQWHFRRTIMTILSPASTAASNSLKRYTWIHLYIILICINYLKHLNVLVDL